MCGWSAFFSRVIGAVSCIIVREALQIKPFAGTIVCLLALKSVSVGVRSGGKESRSSTNICSSQGSALEMLIQHLVPL